MSVARWARRLVIRQGWCDQGDGIDWLRGFSVRAVRTDYCSRSGLAVERSGVGVRAEGGARSELSGHTGLAARGLAGLALGSRLDLERLSHVSSFQNPESKIPPHLLHALSPPTSGSLPRALRAPPVADSGPDVDALVLLHDAPVSRAGGSTRARARHRPRARRRGSHPSPLA